MFLADEPTRTLDSSTADMVHRALVESVKNKGMTMVVSSHWPKAINRLSDKAMWLETGETGKAWSAPGRHKEFEVCFQKTEDMMGEEVGNPW